MKNLYKTLSDLSVVSQYPDIDHVRRQILKLFLQFTIFCAVVGIIHGIFINDMYKHYTIIYFNMKKGILLPKNKQHVSIR